jgi:hypothetical protein
MRKKRPHKKKAPARGQGCKALSLSHGKAPAQGGKAGNEALQLSFTDKSSSPARSFHTLNRFTTSNVPSGELMHTAYKRALLFNPL